MTVGPLLSISATIVGLMAGGIAVGGFLGHAGPSLSGKSDQELRRATTLGGLIGLGIAIGVVLLSAYVNFLS
jgi:hypothetical protein